MGYRPLRWHRTTGHSQGDLGPSWQPWKIILKETKYFVVKQSAPWKIIVKKRIRKNKYFDLVKKLPLLQNSFQQIEHQESGKLS